MFSVSNRIILHRVPSDLMVIQDSRGVEDSVVHFPKVEIALGQGE